MLRTVLCTHAAPTTPVDRRWASVDSLAHLLSGFPRVWDGSASTTQMSGPAQASLTLRPACLLDLLSGPLSQGFAVAVTRLPSLGFSAPDSYRGVSTELLGRDFHPLERCTFMAHPDMLPLARVLSSQPCVHLRPPLIEGKRQSLRDAATLCRVPSPGCITMGLWFRIPVGSCFFVVEHELS